jgi:hypothetical protein
MLRNLGLKEVHGHTHPHLPTEATCDKNTNGVPVDGIWASPSLDCIAAGYYGFGEQVIGKTDHRMIWADFSYESAFGFQPPEPPYRAPQRLTLQDPRVVKRYNRTLRQEHKRLRLGPRAFALQASIPTGLQTHHQQEYETLAYLDFCAKRHADKTCRKLRMGAIAYSDSLKKARNAVDLWNLLHRKRNGIKASTKKIRRLMRNTGEMTAFELSLSAIETKQKEARKLLKQINKRDDLERLQFGKRLLKAKAKDKNITIQAQTKQVQNAFSQRKLWQRVNRLTGKQRGAPLRSVTAPTDDDDDVRTDCQDKISIEQAFTGEGT